jgi:manganese/zinc/iron transport system permease protein
MLELSSSGTHATLNEEGLTTARRVLRNHVLWELYLNEYTEIAPDHVHFDAERIEHILTPDIIKRLEQILAGKMITRVDPSKGSA